jgi:hypothetical protein
MLHYSANSEEDAMLRGESRFERLDDIERKLAQYADGLTTGQLARLYGVNPQHDPS